MRVKNITGSAGIILPINAHISAQYHGRAFSPSSVELSANGIAIRPSSAGIIAIIITASQMLSAKNDAKASNISHLPLEYFIRQLSLAFHKKRIEKSILF